MDPGELARAIDAMHEDRSRAAAMGMNGAQAANSKYNWGVEEVKLIKFYRDLLGAVS